MENTFATIFSYLQKLPEPVEGFITTGGVPFTAEARITKNLEQAILSRSGKKSLTYIYPDDWGNALNRNGTRIAHYAIPIDEWFSIIRISRSID